MRKDWSRFFILTLRYKGKHDRSLFGVIRLWLVSCTACLRRNDK